MKQKKILGINTHFNISNEDEFSFFSQIGFDGKISLYDYDSIIIDSYIIFNQSDVKKDMFSDGLLINYETAFNYALVFDNLRKKLTDLLNGGKNIYLILNQNDKTKTEIAIEVMLWIMRRQMFIDGNKRVAMLFANKIMIDNGCGIITIAQENQKTFYEKLIKFYETNDNEDLKNWIYNTSIDGINLN